MVNDVFTLLTVERNETLDDKTIDDDTIDDDITIAGWRFPFPLFFLNFNYSLNEDAFSILTEDFNIFSRPCIEFS